MASLSWLLRFYLGRLDGGKQPSRSKYRVHVVPPEGAQDSATGESIQGGSKILSAEALDREVAPGWPDMPERIESFRCRWNNKRASYRTDIVEDVERLLIDLAGLTHRNPADVDPEELRRLNDRINELAGVLNATESRNTGKLDLSVIPRKKGRKRRPGRETKFNANDDARLAAEWTKARNRGAYKPDWARANGMSARELDLLLARDRMRKSREPKARTN